MPKVRKVVKNDSGRVIAKFNQRSKLRIGTRKNGKSAFTMTNEALKDVLNDTNKTRWHNNARTVLRSRGIKTEWHKPLVHQETLADLAHDMQAGNSAA